jgi:F-type H+-transporting ATPase subunit delta
MAKTQHNSPVALAYASSLLDLASEQNDAEQIGQELAALRQIVQENRSFAVFLASPAIGHVERTEFLTRIFGGKLSKLMHNFIGVLNEKGRMSSLSQIADAYDDLLAEKLGKIDVDVTVATKLSPELLEDVRKRVSAALKKDAIVQEHVDDSIIGGLIIRVGDKLMDASVKTQLAAMKQQLLAAASSK